MSREAIPFFASEAMAEALAQRAQDDGISRSELVRRACAAFIDYDLEAEPKTERARKYANKAERDKAQRERAKVQRQKTHDLMEAVRKGAKESDILAIARSMSGKSETADAIVAAADQSEA